MLNKTFFNIISIGFLCFMLNAQDKPGEKKEMEAREKTAEPAADTGMMKKDTEMSEKTSPAMEMSKDENMTPMMQITPTEEMDDSPEMKALLEERKQLFMELNDADKEMKMLISKSLIWDKERNTEKKGQLDTILDKADRLAFSNELRMKLSNQAKVISSVIAKINLMESKIVTQKGDDIEKRRMEALKKDNERLKREKMALEAKVKSQESNTHTVTSTQAVQKKNEENVEYFTITEDTNLQTIALSYYQDFEKWIIIYEHPDNMKNLKQKSPTAIIPIGTVLTIPKLTEE